MRMRIFRSLALGILLVMGATGTAGGADPRLFEQALLAVEYDNGKLWAISLRDLTVELVGETGVPFISALEMAPDGTLYGFTSGPSPVLYRIDSATADATEIAPLDSGFLFEGALAFGPDGIAFASNRGTIAHTSIMTVDVRTGATRPLSRLEGDRHDINGLAWRDDGLLVGLDRFGNALRVIDPWTGRNELLAGPLRPLGNVGGMTVLADQAYFVTGGPGGRDWGTHALFRVDLASGRIEHLMDLRQAIPRGSGLSGLSVGVVHF